MTYVHIWINWYDVTGVASCCFYVKQSLTMWQRVFTAKDLMHLLFVLCHQLSVWLLRWSLISCRVTQVGTTGTSEAKDNGGGVLGLTTAARRPSVVVFVKDQHRPQHLQQQRHQISAAGGELAADSASNTDSGNGTSEYSDDPSPPFVVSSATASAGERTVASQPPCASISDNLITPN